MKSTRILTAILIALFLVLAMITCASAAEVHPVPVDHDRVDLNNGIFSLTISNRDRISNGGYFIAVLYQEDCYDGEQIRALVPGDTVYADDRKWTVKEIVLHSDGEDPDEPASYEIYTEEEMDGYLAFWPRTDGSYVAVINDWNPVVLLGSVKVQLPLTEDFEYIRIVAGEEEDPVGAQEFINDLEMFSQDSFTAYNTTCYIADSGVTYFAYVNRIQACKHNHAFFGKICPKCGEPMSTEYVKIVGFYTPVSSWSSDRKVEYKLRQWESVNEN